MEKEFIPLKQKLEELSDDDARVAYLENYLKEHSGIPLGLLAAIYEWLGELHNRQERLRGSYFEKAASTWEMIAVLEASDEGIGRRFRRDAFREAVRIYRLANEAYKKANMYESAQVVDKKISLVKDELRKYGGPGKAAGLFLVVIIFIASFVMLSGPPTMGFVVYPPMEENGTTLTGIGLVVLGIIGAIFVLWKWR
ncbi:MAG: hypothetical protein KKD18_00175 [Nanoarchaeota archaeon]|nr:hypothetical protein [Nanoarchaeota archaeon]MBU0976814.1 hypothetical protein [Nanoarchaeota archaeon]